MGGVDDERAVRADRSLIIDPACGSCMVGKRRWSDCHIPMPPINRYCESLCAGFQDMSGF